MLILQEARVVSKYALNGNEVRVIARNDAGAGFEFSVTPEQAEAVSITQRVRIAIQFAGENDEFDDDERPAGEQSKADGSGSAPSTQTLPPVIEQPATLPV